MTDEGPGGARAGSGAEADPNAMLLAIPSTAPQRPDRLRDPTPVVFVQRLGDAWVQWSVIEVDASAVPGARATRCLLFSRHECIRRVWNYPADWRALDAEALTALSWHR